MQPWFEAVLIPEGRSCLIYDRQLPAFGFNWHYHPEFELTLTVGSRGTRFVGGHVDRYDDGDLVLLGPNLPHAWQSEALVEPTGLHRAIVCWFTAGWIEGLMTLVPEFATLAPLLAEAERGIRFDGVTSGALRSRLIALTGQAPAEQIVSLQAILIELSHARSRRTLAAGALSMDELSADRRRMERILRWIHANFDQPIRLAPLCDLAHLTESQLQRIFKRSTRVSISDYVARLRVGHASNLLIETDWPTSEVAASCGYSDAAHLAHKFRLLMGCTPTAYRRRMRASGTPDADCVFPMRPRLSRRHRPARLARPGE